MQISTSETKAPLEGPVRKTRWGSVIFMLLIHLAVFAGIPIYLRFHGLVPGDVYLFAASVLLTSFAINVGYHRLFAHTTFKAHPAVRFALLFFGAATFQQSALKWSSLHRRHHQHTDTDLDPYNIKRGFFYAHVGWILFWKQRVRYDNVPDLAKDRLLMHQHEHYRWWSLGSGLVLPVLIGFAYGSPWGGLLFGVGARLFVVFHSTFLINSFAHTFGTSEHDSTISARDHWLGAFLINGEGYHNYHHKYPNDYRNGIRWYHWDPGKWLIRGLARVGLATDLKRSVK